MKDLRERVGRMGEVEIAVVGDSIADVYWLTRPSRLSREAPVIVVRHEAEEVFPGGAANTARNLAALGARVHLVSDVGADPAGERVRAMLAADGVGVAPLRMRPDRPTVTKTRILAGDPHRTKQQLFRIDREPARPPEAGGPADAIARLEEIDGRVAGYVVSDYGYDLLEPPVIEWLRSRARRKPVIVDSRHRLRSFSGVSVITPNEEEAEETADLRIEGREDALAVGQSLLETLRVGAVLLTRGKNGMILFERGVAPCELPIVGTGEVVDVSGAGDTVVAAFAAASLAGASAADAARISNCAASVVVMKVGAATCRADELLAVLERAGAPG